MFNVYHYNHWSSGHAIVVATSQPLAGGYTPADETEAAKAFVPVDKRETLEEAIAAAKNFAKAAGLKNGTERNSSMTPTVDGSKILYSIDF